MEKFEENRFKITSDYCCIENEKVFRQVLKVLMAYAHNLIGTSTLRLDKNRNELAYDLSMDAIKTYLENPKNFNPKRNPDLINYLKYYILKQKISNFKKLAGQKNELIHEDNDPTGLSVKNRFKEEMDIHESIDLKETVKLIKGELVGDDELKKLFNLRYELDYKRKEVCEELKIQTTQYDNKIRRLETILRRVIKSQEIQSL